MSQRMGSLDLGDEDVEMSQQMPFLGPVFDIELGKAEEGDAKTLQLQLKKTAMEELYNKAVGALTQALGGFNKEQFLKSLEENVLYEGGDLSVFYQELAKLDALNWLERHQNELLELELPLAIELSINYQRNAQPETLITFYTKARELIEPPKKTGARSREQDSERKKEPKLKKSRPQKGPLGAPAPFEKSERRQEPSDAPAPASDDFQKEAVKGNGKTNKANFAERGLKYGSRREKKWVKLGDREEASFAFKRPKSGARDTTDTAVYTWDGVGYTVNTGVVLDQVFGVNRITTPSPVQGQKRGVYFENDENLERYQRARKYWEEEVKEKSGSARANWNPANPGVQLTERAYNTPYSAAPKEGLNQTYHYVRTDGELTSATKQEKDAPKTTGGEATSSDLES
jgi:hypothetical protein